MTKIRISPAASVTPSPSGVLLRSDLGTFELKGEDVRLFVSQMVPLLDGSRDPQAIAEALPSFSTSSVLSFLELLRQKGLTEPMPEADESETKQEIERWLPQRRFFTALEVDPEEAARRLQNSRVLLVGAEPWGATAALELAAAGVGEIRVLDSRPVSQDDLLAVRAFDPSALGTPRGEALQAAIANAAPWTTVSCSPLPSRDLSLEDLSSEDLSSEDSKDQDLVLTALTADDAYHLERAARFAQQAGIRSLGGHLDGFEAWIGPGVVPGETACWNCLTLRRLAHADDPRPAHELDARLRDAPAATRARAFLGPMGSLTGHLLAMEALKLLTAFAPPRILGRVYVQNLVTHEGKYHKVVRMPWCSVCGGASKKTAEPKKEREPEKEPALFDLRQSGDVDGLRQVLEGWVDERTGVIKNLFGDTTPPRAGTPLPLTSSAMVARYTEGHLTHIPGGEIGSGKGLDPLSAHIGAVGEAIERYSAARYRKSDLRREAPAAMNGNSLDPQRLVLYDDEQYRREGFPYRPFDPQHPIHWVQGKWFGTDQPVWVPALVAFFNFQTCAHEAFCQVSSNGLAAGSSVEDAGLRAVFELIERDAFMLSWYAQLPGRPIILDDTLAPQLQEVLRQQEAKGIAYELYLFDLGSGIPTVVSLGLGDGQRSPAVTVALAAHADPQVAVAKAILEQAHVGPYMDRQMQTSKIPANAEEVLGLEDHALYYVPLDRVPCFDFMRKSGLDPIPLKDLEAQVEPTVEACRASLEAGGYQIAVVDVTSPDVAQSPFRVARAVGLDIQPIHFGEHLRRLTNPRLAKLLAGRPPNPHPHPVA